jgi:hypothetical protein
MSSIVKSEVCLIGFCCLFIGLTVGAYYAEWWAWVCAVSNALVVVQSFQRLTDAARRLS